MHARVTTQASSAQATNSSVIDGPEMEGVVLCAANHVPFTAISSFPLIFDSFLQFLILSSNFSFCFYPHHHSCIFPPIFYSFIVLNFLADFVQIKLTLD